MRSQCFDLLTFSSVLAIFTSFAAGQYRNIAQVTCSYCVPVIGFSLRRWRGL